jgi:glycine cleavage system transcriptional repressor
MTTRHDGGGPQAPGPAGEIFLVLSALGPDRPGLVAEVTEYLTLRGANVEDSRMAVLGGEFGILVLVSGAPDRITAVEKDHEALSGKTGLAVMFRRTKSPAEHRRAAVIPCLVTAEAIDQEGIVRAVSRALHQLGVNIVSLETTAFEAPVTGSPLFRLEARVDVPQTTGIAKVRKAMEEVATAESLDVDVRSLVARGGGH